MKSEKTSEAKNVFVVHGRTTDVEKKESWGKRIDILKSL